MGDGGWGALLLLLQLGGCSVASFDSASYLMTALSEPSLGLPQFIATAHLNDQLMGVYDSNRERILPYAPWVRKLEKEDPKLWDTHTQYMRNQRQYLQGDLSTVQKQHNQSGGLHTWQYKVGCGLREDGGKGGFAQYSYDGKVFITFDKETLTWVVAHTTAQLTKRMWEADLPFCQSYEFFLDEECIAWLRKYLDYGKEALQRKDPPMVKVTHKDHYDGLETLLCQAHGFYPKEIDLTWRKDGEVRQGDTFHGVVSPNTDGTYYTWLSIEISPKERSHYWCHVEHDGLQQPLEVAMEDSVSVWLAVGFIVGVIVVVLVGIGIFRIIRYTRRLSPETLMGMFLNLQRAFTSLQPGAEVGQDL